MVMKRGEVYLVNLDPTVGREIRKSRPCVVVSPDELNRHLSTVLAAPMTTGSRPAAFRVAVRFSKKDGLVLPEQVRCVDKTRLIKKLGRVKPAELKAILSIYQAMFAEAG